MKQPSLSTRVQQDERALQQLIHQLRKRRFTVAMLGESGSGKSSLINRFAEAYVAPIGAIETTMDAQHVDIKDTPLTLVDLPGYGTQAWPTPRFFEHFNLPQYDAAILVLGARIKTDDIEMFERLKSANMPFYVVRNFIDIALEGEGTRKSGDAMSYNDLLEQIRQDARVQFRARELTLYAISSRPDQPRFDLEALRKEMIDAARENILERVRARIHALSSRWSDASGWTRTRYYTRLAARTLTLSIPQNTRTVGMLVTAYAMGMSDATPPANSDERTKSRRT